ncbi:MAG: arginine decarboxylase, partial [Roseiflexaceae bacterium]|nr:arginine decarboxylase [Roseiflexaceae bacterium]
MNQPTYLDYLQNRYRIAADGTLTDFLSRRDGRLLLADTIDLSALAERYGAPLEVAYMPLITTQIERMFGYAAEAHARTGYLGSFLYAYATKANFAEEVVRTALNAGAQHETSSAADVVIAHYLWRQGVLPESRYIFCNGSKEQNYIAAIVNLRKAGFAKVCPIIDEIAELEAFLTQCAEPMLFGVRERHAAEHVDPGHFGGERFGLTQQEIARVAARLEGTPHKLIVYHAMVGSQIENLDGWMDRLADSAASYARLRQLVPTLQLFNFGGGMPTSAYALDFAFDYTHFLERLMATLAEVAAAHGVPQPDIIGEFGRYTVASHNVFLLEVGAVKPAQAEMEPWYLVNGSMMVSLPDMLIVDDQQFVVLPLDRWEQPARPVRLGGRRTCDSDDVFPRPGQAGMMLPEQGEGLIFGVFGVGAYQQMIAGRGGAHHCLSPEMRRIIIEQEGDQLTLREVLPQSVAQIMGLLGYNREALEPVLTRTPARPRESTFVVAPRRRSSSARQSRQVPPA